MIVDLVNVTTRDGLRLDGILRGPARPSASRLGVDLVVLHHGVGGNFYTPGMFDQYGDALLDQDCAVLRVNNRGHDLVSRVMAGAVSKRLGAAYEDMEGCGHDWEAWIDFAPRRRLPADRSVGAQPWGNQVDLLHGQVPGPADHLCRGRFASAP